MTTLENRVIELEKEIDALQGAVGRLQNVLRELISPVEDSSYLANLASGTIRENRKAIREHNRRRSLLRGKKKNDS